MWMRTEPVVRTRHRPRSIVSRIPHLSYLLPLVLLAVASPASAQSGVLNVSWDSSPDPGVTLYRVYYGTDPASLGLVVDVPAPQTSVQLSGLTALATYYVEVGAIRASGCESPRSGQLSGVARDSVPMITPLGPIAGDTCVSPGDTVLILVEDLDENVDSSSLVVLVNGSAVTPGVSGSGGSLTLSFPLPASLPASRVVTVEVTAADTAVPPNVGNTSYSFTVEPIAPTGVTVN